MPWDPAAEGNDPGILAQRAEISYGAKVVLYPAPSGDHDALAALLSELVDPRFPPAAELPARTGVTATAIGTGTASARPPVPALWVHGAETTEHFTGRVEELTRLDRWAADKKVENPLTEWEIEGRAFSAEMLPAGNSASGFVYFQSGLERGATLYVSGIAEAASGKQLLYFEIPMGSPLLNAPE